MVAIQETIYKYIKYKYLKLYRMGYTCIINAIMKLDPARSCNTLFISLLLFCRLPNPSLLLTQCVSRANPWWPPWGHTDSLPGECAKGTRRLMSNSCF